LNKLEKLEAMFNRQREQDVHATNQSPVIQELRAEVAKLREQLATCQKKHEDLEVEVAELREQLARGQKKHKDLEAEVGELRDIVDDGEGVELADIQDDIKSLETRIDFVERGKDDDELSKRIKEEIFDEMAARVKGGQ
jgi:chromosome segregation ATPase